MATTKQEAGKHFQAYWFLWREMEVMAKEVPDSLPLAFLKLEDTKASLVASHYAEHDESTCEEATEGQQGTRTNHIGSYVQ